MKLRFIWILALTAITALMVTSAYSQVRAYRVTDRQMQNLLTRIESSTDRFRSLVDRDMDNSTQNGTRYEEGVMEYMNAFENATDRLVSNFKDRRSTQSDVEEVLGRASVINGFVARNYLQNDTVAEWTRLRGYLNTLAAYYRTSWDWNSPRYQVAPTYTLTGTYRLNPSKSDNVVIVIDRILGGIRLGNTERETYRQSLQDRLTAPELYAIEQRDPQFTIGSSLWPQVTFNADGRTFTERGDNGRTFRVTALHSVANGLVMNYAGDRNNDYYVNFARQQDGLMRVTRRLFVPERNETVTVSSVYERISETPQWMFDARQYPAWQTGSYGYIVPNNTQLRAVLYSPISTRSSQNGERFDLQVTYPAQFRGAVISGRINSVQRSGFMSGRATMSFVFENIRMQNGMTYAFSGIVNQVLLPNGNRVEVDNEGAIREKDQMQAAVIRAGVGAAVGAVIGAVSSGKKGAAVGALLGAGAGIGSILLQGRDDVELVQGTEFAITASAPNNVLRYR